MYIFYIQLTHVFGKDGARVRNTEGKLTDLIFNELDRALYFSLRKGTILGK